MPRQRTQNIKESTNYRYCRYCKANRDKRRFDKHQAACKIIWQQQDRQQKLQLSSEPINEQTERKKIDNSLIKVNFRLPRYTILL
jgi:bisphosphoglycerate-independent phosphoglycerate mutase (AlkP superfamily)